MPQLENLGEVHLLSLEGLGASYRMNGYFTLKAGERKRINFKGVAFGGHYGGHNVNIQISDKARKILKSLREFEEDDRIEELLTEVQRRILNGEMVVEFEKLKQGENVDPFGNISS